MPENALLPIADKLGKLIPMLSSDRDGEKLAAIAAIERTLKARKLDFNDFARAITEPPPPRIIFVERDQDPAREPKTWEEIAKWCRDHNAGRLADHERKFVWDMAARLIRDGQPTDRQADWLRALYSRLRRPA